MYWIGLREGDVHWNISSPGWAKHAWSSVFAPWNAGATIFVLRLRSASTPRRALDDDRALRRDDAVRAADGVAHADRRGPRRASRCALREVVGAGEPLNPEVIERVRRAWGLTIRDGYGQTETTAQVGNPPGQPVKPGSMGRPLPGYRIALLDARRRARRTRARSRSALDPPPLGLMAGYLDDAARRRRRWRRLLPHRRRGRSATPTATSPTSAAPTTCSRAPTTASARSSSRAR